MDHTIDDVVDAVRGALQGLPPNLDITGFTTSIPYPPLRTPLRLDGIALDPFIRPGRGLNAYVAADVYEDFINHYILGNDTPALSPREYLIRELELTKSDGKWIFPNVKEQERQVELALFYLVRLAWAIGKASGNPMSISDKTLIIDGLPNVGVLGGKFKSVWFADRLPLSTFNVEDLLYSSNASLRLRGDNMIRAYHNAGNLGLEQRTQVRMALRILTAGYRKKLDLSQELHTAKRKPAGKAFRKNLRRVAGEIRGFPGNPAPMIYRQLVTAGVIDEGSLFKALPGFQLYSHYAADYPLHYEHIKTWARELRKLGG